MQKEPTELVQKIYSAQKTNSNSGDFCELVSENLKTLRIPMNEDHIKSTSSETFKKNVKIKVHEAALEYLLKEQKEHSKVKDIKYKKLEIKTVENTISNRKERAGPRISQR